jgi:leucyl-tRNA---protein transferase
MSLKPDLPVTPPPVDEYFVSISKTPEQMDVLWESGWRHFGPLFFRYSYSEQNGPRQIVQPLRVRLDRFAITKKHRRVLRKNEYLEVKTGPPVLDAEREQLFERHKSRFKTNVPECLRNFLGPDLRIYPCSILELAVLQEGEMIAASYLDLGRRGASSVYAFFDPAHSRRSLGILTMLHEVRIAAEHGCAYYYPGYAFHERSAMDYKKQFPGTEWFDWQGQWHPLKNV